MNDDKAVVRVTGIKERVISYAWDKRVLIIVGGFFAIIGLNDLRCCIRFVGAQVDIPVFESWISVQIENWLTDDAVATVDAKAIGLEPPIAAKTRASSGNVWVVEPDVKIG